MTNAQINERLCALTDDKYRAFNTKIVNAGCPTIGVRTPDLKNLAKQIAERLPRQRKYGEF